MKKYKLIVTMIIAVGVILIGTSNPISNIYKSTNFINKFKLDNPNKDNKENDKSQNENYIICIDPGHQQKGDSTPEPIGPGSPYKKARVSSGATGVATKKPEYILNLEASIVLKNILESKGYTVIMTRETHDINISNAERATLANEKKANMVIRVHADSLDNSGKTGASLLVPQQNGKYTSGLY